jgi:hypothetical protein
MDFNKLIHFTNNLEKHGYVLTNNGILNKKEFTYLQKSDITLNDYCVEFCKILDVKQAEGVLIQNKRKTKHGGIHGYKFKHVVERLSNTGIYITLGQMIIIAVMKNIIYDWKVGDSDIYVKLKLDKKYKQFL